MMQQTVTQTTQIVIYRSGLIYIYGRWLDGVRRHEQVISANEARRIISLHPAGSTDNAPVDFTHSPCFWRWSVEVDNGQV